MTEIMQHNYRITIMYDGSRYYGFQRQPDKDTIQGKLEGVLRQMTGDETLEVIGAGRTDAGVHAMNMIANVNMKTELSVQDIKDYLNRYLPDDICVKRVDIAGARFHARYNALGKTYRYTCYTGPDKPVFERKYVYYLKEEPDMDKMKDMAGLLLGEHDFHNFCMNPRMKKSTVRKVDRIDIIREDNKIQIYVHGNGFLQNMVRIMVGTLLEAGYGRLSREEVLEALNGKERKKAGPTAPAQGLCLMEVDYD